VHIRRESPDSGEQTQAERRQDIENFSGPVPNTVLLLLLAAEMRPSQPAITCASSVSPSRRSSALTSTFHIHVQRAFTGFVRFEGFVVRWTVTSESAKALVHAFVSSRVDGRNAVLAGSSKATTDHLQC